MINTHYTVRNYQPSDFDRYTQLRIKAEKLEPTGRLFSPQIITENLSRPDFSPEQDLFFVETNGEIVGYMEIFPERTIKRVILDCWIHPEHRKKGLATTLLGYAMKRAEELGAIVAHVNISQEDEIAISVLSKLGFRCFRRYLQLRLDMDKVNRQDISLSSLGCRHLQTGEEAELTRIQNRAFANHWGYNPYTIEMTTLRLNLGNRSPADVLVACDGNKLTGYCWTDVIIGGEAVGGERKGLIYMIGTDPDYQGKGIGKRVLLAGLTHLNNKGLKATELAVDSENKVAYQLYRSVGFKVKTHSLWYEKAVD
jgi:mycothiol synthase